MNFEELQKHLNKVTSEHNHSPNSAFEGLSPFEMHHLLHFTFEKESPLKLLKLSDADYRTIPILNLIKYLINIIDKAGNLKLTKKGFLPTKVVADLYDQKYIVDDHIESGISKLYKETDTISINLTRLLTELSGIAKKRKGALSLTKKGRKEMQNDDKLFKTIFQTFAHKFNWAYYDGYEDQQIAQMGFGFSIILLSKYGDTMRPSQFYAEKYFQAFPMIGQNIIPSYGTVETYKSSCYSIRTFERFMNFFGMINLSMPRVRINAFNNNLSISRSDLFDRLFDIRTVK